MNVVPVFVSEIRRKHDFYALQAVLLAKLVADSEQMLRIFQNDFDFVFKKGENHLWKTNPFSLKL